MVAQACDCGKEPRIGVACDWASADRKSYFELLLEPKVVDFHFKQVIYN